MEELIREIILNSESDTGFIGDALEIGNVVFELMEDGVEFDCDINELDEMMDGNDILQLTKVVCEECESVQYIVEEVFDDEGYTMPDELDTLFIDSDLVDCVDLEAFGDTEIVVVELEFDDEDECDGDCDNCPYSEDYDEEEDLGCVLTDELISTLSEVDSDDAELVFDLIAEKINEAFEMGYNQAIDDATAELQDSIEAVDSLRLED
jgi:uncharacterized protein (DUF2164 family)